MTEKSHFPGSSSQGAHFVRGKTKRALENSQHPSVTLCVTDPQGSKHPGGLDQWCLVEKDQFFESPLCANCWTLSATSIISLHHNNPVRDLRGPDSVEEPESEHRRSDGIPPVVLSPVLRASPQGPILRQGFLEEAAPPGTLRGGEGLGCRWLERRHCRLYVGGARGAGG